MRREGRKRGKERDIEASRSERKHGKRDEGRKERKGRENKAGKGRDEGGSWLINVE